MNQIKECHIKLIRTGTQRRALGVKDEEFKNEGFDRVSKILWETAKDLKEKSEKH